jgi:hypothetical protein
MRGKIIKAQTRFHSLDAGHAKLIGVFLVRAFPTIDRSSDRKASKAAPFKMLLQEHLDEYVGQRAFGAMLSERVSSAILSLESDLFKKRGTKIAPESSKQQI